MSPSASPAIDPRTVRSQALWAAIAAAMMLYIGFTYSLAVDAFPAQLLFMTLRYGGIAMAVSAVLLLTGWPAALMIDGVFAMIIGAALALAGALWIIEIRTVDLQPILHLVFGYLFFTSGLRGFRDYCKLGEITASAAEEVVTATAPGHATGTPTDPPSESLATKLRAAQSNEAPAPAGSSSADPPRIEPPPAAPSNEVRETPEGYLSSFAPEEDADTDQPR